MLLEYHANTVDHMQSLPYADNSMEPMGMSLYIYWLIGAN